MATGARVAAEATPEVDKTRSETRPTRGTTLVSREAFKVEEEDAEVGEAKATIMAATGNTMATTSEAEVAKTTDADYKAASETQQNGDDNCDGKRLRERLKNYLTTWF